MKALILSVKMWGSDNICIRKKKKFGGKKLAGAPIYGALAFLEVGVYAKMENGGDCGKMVENWVLFCIKVGGELLGFKHF